MTSDFTVHMDEYLPLREVVFNTLRQICTALLKEGKKKGATRAYLQVVEGNTPARSLYESLGLNFVYTYWFRVQTQTDRV